MVQRLELPAEFWDRFVEESWERRPLVLRQAFAAPVATVEEIFEAAALRPGDRLLRRFFVENARVESDQESVFPTASDGSFRGYAKRVEARTGGRPFGLIASDLQANSIPLFERFTGFLRPLLERVGLPAGALGAILETYVGNYPRTPGGAHTDEGGVFVFAVEGTKTMRIWPREMRELPEFQFRSTYGPLLGDALTVRLEPGDAVYWPRGYPHVGECDDGGFSITLTLGVFLDGSAARFLGNCCHHVLEEQLGEAGRIATYRPEERQMDGALRSAVDLFRSATTDIERRAAIEWVRVATSSGWHRVPAPLPPEALEDEAIVSGRREAPILIAPVPGESGTLIVGANGHVFQTEASSSLGALVDRLNAGGPASVGALLAEHGQDADTDPEDLRTILETLLRFRGIARVETLTAPRPS